MSEQHPPRGSGNGHPLIDAAHRLAADVLRPAAAAVDTSVVPASHVAALKASGILGAVGPRSAGGAAVPGPVDREIHEILVGACGSTWFVALQHAGPLRTVADRRGPAHDRLLRPLCDGRLLAATAVSQLRAHESCPTRVRRVDGGWRFDGVVPWLTSWGLADVMMLGGLSADDEVVFVVVDAVAAAGLRPSAPMRTAALAAARTVRLHLDGFVVPDSALVGRRGYDEWAALDRRAPVNVNPAVFGLAREAVRLLAEAGRDEVAGRLGASIDRLRADAYALIDEIDPDERRADRVRIRVEAGELALRATAAAVTAGGGRAMALSSPAQRLAREALFLTVQAQTPEVRDAQLAAIG